MLVILAEFAVAPDHRAEFLELCRLDATRSVADEPGCHLFEAHTDETDPNSIILYEVYADEAAFQAHLQTPHYATFAEGVERLGVTRARVRRLTRV